DTDQHQTRRRRHYFDLLRARGDTRAQSEIAAATLPTRLASKVNTAGENRMKMLPGFQRSRHKKGLLAASSLLLLLATQTIAQSGRRAAPKPAQPVPTPQTDSDTTAKNSAREVKEPVSLL